MPERSKVLKSNFLGPDQLPPPDIPLAAGARGYILIGWDDEYDPHYVIVKYKSGSVSKEYLTGSRDERKKQLKELQDNQTPINEDDKNTEK